MPLSQEIDITLCQSYTKTNIKLLQTEPHDQILNDHWWKFWSHDTDGAMRTIKMNRYYIKIKIRASLNYLGTSGLS